MALSISELKQKWKAESKEYRTQEVGSGVQKFVKDVLESSELFALSQGKLSTDARQRRNEFTEETRAKQGRQADVVIYIDSDIVIPTEVEKFGHIELGEEQLNKYQTDFDKQYGILTDGYEWRFYNNNLFKTFLIDEILNGPEPFLSFWKSYIQPLNYYINFFDPLGQQKIFDKANDLSVEKNRVLFFEDITKLIHSLENKLNIAGYLASVEENLKKKKAIELTYAYVIQFILYKTLVDNEFDDFKQEFDQRVDGIRGSLKSEHFKQALSTIQGISDEISHNIYRPFAKEQEVISETLRQILSAPKNTLAEVAPWLDIFVFIKKYNFANVKNDIFGYIYENYLKDLYEDEQKGQYFTDPSVVEFMLDQVDYTSENIINRYRKDPTTISIIDPSCGSGTFLYAATRRIAEAFSGDNEAASKLIEQIVSGNIFGLDIEEFPLYLAEMNILMRLMQYVINENYNNPIDKKIKVFWTKDSLSEFQNTSLKNTFADQDTAFQKAGGSSEQVQLFTKKIDLGYASYVRNESDIEDMKQSLENRENINRYRFDFVVGNPPYIGYNASSKMGILFFQLLREKKVQLSDVYGANLHSVPSRPKSYRPNPNLYAFFIALGLALLKDDGRLCYIIPQTLLTAGDLDVLRYHLAKFTTIEKIIIPDSKMFIGRGIKQTRPVATSSLIIVLRRATPSLIHKTEIVHHADSTTDIETCLRYITLNKKTRKQLIPQQKLLAHFLNWNFIKQPKEFVDFYEKYINGTEDFSIYYNHKLAEHFFNSAFYFDSGYDIDEKLRNSQPYPEVQNYEYVKLGATFSIKNNSGYWPNIRSTNSKYQIKLRQANQGYSLLDSPFKIIWSYSNPKRFHITSKPVIWARNQYCSIGSVNENETLYLLGLLNSKVTWSIIDGLLKNENEKSLLLSTSSIKEFIRVPLVSEKNLRLKAELIKKVQNLIDQENTVVGDIVDFSKVLQQKFDSAIVDQNQIILTRGKGRIILPIKSSAGIVKKCLNGISSVSEISLTVLKNLPVIDMERQASIEEKIDQLVYKLYNLTPEEIQIIEEY